MAITKNNTPLHLYEKIWESHKLSRFMDSITLLFLLMLLAYRLFSLNNLFTLPYFLAFLCESWFTFTWLTTISTKWTPSHTRTNLKRLLLLEHFLPPVDIFVTTADPVLEPPIITVNTVLSLLALDYPSHLLSCYVSDDGCSPHTFYALVQASNFAKLWVPFCKKFNVQVRAPFRYFSGDSKAYNSSNIPGFKQEKLKMKKEYELLCQKIQNADQKSELVEEFANFSNTQQRNHPTIVKVIWENKEGVSNGVPHLIYISREKRPEHPHHYKAGAMNVLTRVSGLMTNAPFMLNVDCDMYVNNPEVVQHALCILLDSKGEKEVAFVQCPQRFYDAVKDDAFGNQQVALPLYIGSGFAGLQGIIYAGTNCFHRRKVIYGESPHLDIQNGNKDHAVTNGILSEKEQTKTFGTSKEFVKSAASALKQDKYTWDDNCNIHLDHEEVNKVSSCVYEYNTAWGKQVGWIYGSTSEDVLTGLKFHTKGWRSEFCTTDPIAFRGCSPQDSVGQMSQHKRWSSGLLEIFLSKHCPIFGTIFGNLELRECLAYIWITTWALRSVPEICYALLPAYSIIINSTFLPNQGVGLWIPAALVLIYNISTLLEQVLSGMSIRTWWNNQRMARITTMNSCFFGFLAVILKQLRISGTVFEITKKEEPSSSCDGNSGRFTFNESPIFIPGTTILLVQLIALVINFSIRRGSNTHYGFGEVFCSAYVVLCYLPFLKGLFGRGKYGIPLSTICKSTVLAFLFVQLCRWQNS
ncbi:hypothetical protein PIB30_030366 [Stylosanthes scabra]|uniref:Cellulose synthase-like protein H1 n=1 Tax=Stylosanthes scabra TaxID=79078 RepID=A0ABU6WA26_9FABA|nr:hypothetical protein [Stylosanthes scabra]